MSVSNIRSIADCSDLVSQADELAPPMDRESAGRFYYIFGKREKQNSMLEAQQGKSDRNGACKK